MKQLGCAIIVISIILSAGQVSAGLININTATVSELQELPRIGPGLAQSIIDYRESRGPFTSIEELKNVPRIGEKTYDGFKHMITVDQTGTSHAPEPVPASGAYEPIVKFTPIPTPIPAPTPDIKQIMSSFAIEPTINEVQAETLRYAQIDNQRFSEWRRNARNKALLPDRVYMRVKNDTDDDTDYARSKSISLSGGTVTLGPDDEVWGHDTDDDWTYEMSLTWDLQEYVFNPDMLKVSSETEDQVKLRQDILEDVTKVYFDRRRLQIEMMLNTDLDPISILKNQLRLDEMTAMLDGMTGGYFSREIEKRKSGNQP